MDQQFRYIRKFVDGDDFFTHITQNFRVCDNIIARQDYHLILFNVFVFGFYFLGGDLKEFCW